MGRILTLISSAYMKKVFPAVMYSGRSFMNIINIKGPKMLPCDIPRVCMMNIEKTLKGIKKMN